MPSEHRQIVFSVPEIIAALMILSGETGILPRGRVASLKVIEEGGAIIGLASIVAKGGRRSTDQTLSAEVLGPGGGLDPPL